MFRRSGYRFADKNTRHSTIPGAWPGSKGTGHALGLERILHKYRVLAFGARRQERHRAADQLLDPAHVFDRLRGQLGPRTGAGGRVLPAFDRFVNRLDRRLRALAGRKIVDLPAAEAVADADIDALEAVEDVELGQGEAVDAAGAHGLAHQHRVEPAAAPRPPGHRAELATALAEREPDVVVLLGRERPLADPGRVRLADAEHVADRARAEPAAGRRLAGDRVRGGDERIGAVVDVEQDRLRALEQDALALAPLVVEQRPHAVHVGQHLRRHRGKLG